MHHGWPANVRELEQALLSAAALTTGNRIEQAHLPAALRDQEPPSSVKPDPSELSASDRALRDELSRLLSEHAGNLSAVARAMQKDRTQIRRWIERLGLEDARRRS